jgi:hypothetical protein
VPCFLFCLALCFRLRFNDLAGLEATAADAQPLVAAIHLRANGVEIDVPPPPGGVVRVRNVVAELRPFAANITNLSHDGNSEKIRDSAILADCA